MMEFDHELDASGLNCPLPVLRAKKTLKRMDSGQVLKIVATDPGSMKDFEEFSVHTGNTLLQSKAQDGRYMFWLRKA